MNEKNIIKVMNPNNIEDDCCQLIIYDIKSPFKLMNVLKENKTYTFSFYIKSNNISSFKLFEETFNINQVDKWIYIHKTFNTDINMSDISFKFNKEGAYYLYNSKLEYGNSFTTWDNNPLDTDVNNINNKELKNVMVRFNIEKHTHLKEILDDYKYKVNNTTYKDNSIFNDTYYQSNKDKRVESNFDKECCIENSNTNSTRKLFLLGKMVKGKQTIINCNDNDTLDYNSFLNDEEINTQYINKSININSNKDNSEY